MFLRTIGCLVITLLSIDVSYCQFFGLPRDSSNHRRGRFLSLFTYVHFGKSECIDDDGDVGVCLAAGECAQRGGTASGTCAGGYGTCCMFLATCGRMVSENGTYFVNNGYPESFDGTGSCQVTLVKTDSNICQFRLDIAQLTLQGPEPANHICNNDQFIVSGGNPVPAICGNTIGNHLYIDSGAGTTNPIILSVVTSGPSFERMWKIRITQIPCNSNYKAEEGCLQYFTGVSGQILSFNYDPTTGAQLSNQDYGICIRAERNFCAVQYTQCPDNVSANNISQSFTLSGNSNNRFQAMVGSTGPNSCQYDYLIIPMAANVGRPSTGVANSVDRVCGGILSADVTYNPTIVKSTVKPFHLWFHTDGLEAPNDIDNKGFCLNYIQQPCTSG